MNLLLAVGDMKSSPCNICAVPTYGFRLVACVSFIHFFNHRAVLGIQTNFNQLVKYVSELDFLTLGQDVDSNGYFLFLVD